MSSKLRYLQNILNNSGIQEREPALFQVVSEILLAQDFGGSEVNSLYSDPLKLTLDGNDGLQLENTQQSGLAQYPLSIDPQGFITARRLHQTVFMQNGVNQNVTTTPFNVINYTTTPNILRRNGDSLMGIVAGNFAANTNAKTLQLSFDGTVLYTISGRADGTAGTFYVQFFVQRANNTTMTGKVFALYNNAAGVMTIVPIFSISKAALDFTINNYLLRFIATGVATGDITWNSPQLTLVPTHAV